MLRIILSAVDQPLHDAWKRHCSEFEFVEVVRGDILGLSADALVSPANSFGFMDGGIDLAYSEFFGWELQARVQSQIKSRHFGELPVGCADIVPTGHEAFPFLVVAPTMRVPQALLNSTNPYLAARAVLLLIKHGVFAGEVHDGEPVSGRVKSVAFPGLGTGIGEVAADVCARQVRAAIETVLLERSSFPSSWLDAQKRQYEMVRS